jgi:hypothetical protein
MLFELEELIYLSNDMTTRDDYFYKLQEIKYFNDLVHWLNDRFIFKEPKISYNDLLTHEIYLTFHYTWFSYLGGFNQYYPKQIKINAKDSIMCLGRKIQDYNEHVIYKHNEYTNLPNHLYENHSRKVKFTLHTPCVTVDNGVIIIVYDLALKNDSRKRKRF